MPISGTIADVAESAINAVISGTPDALAAVVHPAAVNRESIGEPLGTRGTGPEAFRTTGEWLRAAFADLRWTSELHVVDNDIVVTYGHLSERQTGEFVVWTAQGTVDRAFAPTGKTFTVRQAHFQRITDGLVIDHWAVRDDRGMAVQLDGYLLHLPSVSVPPSHQTGTSQYSSVTVALPLP